MLNSAEILLRHAESALKYILDNMLHTTHGGENLTTLLVKYFNDLPGVQRSERNRNEVTFFYVGDVLCIHLGSKYADFQEKIFPETSWRK